MNHPPVVLEMVIRSWLGVTKRFVVGLEPALFPAPLAWDERRTNGAKAAPFRSGPLTGMAHGAKRAIAPSLPAQQWRSAIPHSRDGAQSTPLTAGGTTQPAGIREEIAAARGALAEKSIALAQMDDRLRPVTGRIDSIMSAMRATHRVLHSDRLEQDLVVFDPARKPERVAMYAELDALRANPATMALRKDRNELRSDVKALEREIEGMQRQLTVQERKRRKATANVAA